MLYFAAHDPGARNHIRPAYELALRQKKAAEFIDLSVRSEFLDERFLLGHFDCIRPKALICGCSMNQQEWKLVRACNRVGIQSAMIIDIGIGPRFDGVNTEEFPQKFLVTNLGTASDLIELGAAPAQVVLAGSAHLERIAQQGRPNSGPDVKQVFGLDPATNLVPLFCTPLLDDCIGAVTSLATLLATTALTHAQLIVRPHPRSPELDALEAACRQFPCVTLDAAGLVDTPSLLSASPVSFSMSSTVTLESQVLGIPSAFYLMGWDSAELEWLYQHVEGVTKIRDAGQLSAFISDALGGSSFATPQSVENHEGALERTWDALQDLI